MIRVAPLIVVTAIVASMASASVRQETAPPVNVNPMPAIPGADPSRPDQIPAVPLPASDAVDLKAMEIYRRAVEAAKALKSFDGVIAIQFEGGDPDEAKMLSGMAVPRRVRMELSGDSTSAFGRLRIDSPAPPGSTSTLTYDGQRTLLVNHTDKTFIAADGEAGFFGVAPDLSMSIPMFLLKLRSDEALSKADAAVVAASVEGRQTSGKVDCDVISIVREVRVANDDDAAPEGATTVLRESDVLLIGVADGIVRSEKVRIEMVGRDDRMPMPCITASEVTVNPGFGPNDFSTTPPEGYRDVSPPPAPAEEPSAPQLTFKIGDKAPPFSLKDMARERVTLESLKDRVVLLDFWATWCGPCRQTMPVLQNLVAEFKDKPVDIVGVNMGERTPDAGRDFMTKKGYTYRCLFEGDDLATTYGITGIPTIIIIDKSGVISDILVGSHVDGGAKLRTAINAALAK